MYNARNKLKMSKNNIVNAIVEDKNIKISKVHNTYIGFVESVFEKVIDNVDSLGEIAVLQAAKNALIVGSYINQCESENQDERERRLEKEELKRLKNEANVEALLRCSGDALFEKRCIY